MDFNLKDNNLSIVGSIKFNDIIYFIDKDKNIFTKQNEIYSIVTDEKILSDIIKYITPHSIDVK